MYGISQQLNLNINKNKISYDKTVYKIAVFNKSSIDLQIIFICNRPQYEIYIKKKISDRTYLNLSNPFYIFIKFSLIMTYFNFFTLRKSTYFEIIYLY